MRNLPFLFSLIFACLALSWLGIVMANQIQIGGLAPTSETLLHPVEGTPIAGVWVPGPDGTKVMGVNQQTEPQYPLPLTGLAAEGRREYIKQGCLYCHSQQVRRKGFGADYERGWGNRQTVPRDYIRQDRVLLGTMRTGPDLTNVGERLPDATWHYQHLWNPRLPYEHSTMPDFKFLFDVRKIDEETGPSPDALRLTGESAPADGYEVVPTRRAEALVAYLLSLRLDYDLPEARRE